MSKSNWTVRSIAMLAAMVVATGSLADIVLPGLAQGKTAFDITNTGSSVVANSHHWTSNNTASAAFGWAQNGPFYREERWEDPVVLGAIVVDATAITGGDILVDTTGNGNYVKVADFLLGYDEVRIIDLSSDPRCANVYGVKIDVNVEGPSYYDYTIGNVAIFSNSLMSKAFGATTILSGEDGYPGRVGNSVTDMNMGTAWKAEWVQDGRPESTWIGFVVPDGGKVAVDGLRVTSGSWGLITAWTNYAVQVTFDGENWEFLRDDAGNIFKASVAPETTINWIDFGQTLTVMGVRLYGDDDLGNLAIRPSGDQWVTEGLYVDDIIAYQWAPAIPEPATMALLTLGGLAMLRRRK